jgi:hypothetical protein
VQLCCCSFALQGNFSALQEQWSCIRLDRTNAGKRIMVAIEHILLIGRRRLVETFCGTVCKGRLSQTKLSNVKLQIRRSQDG